MLYAHGKKYNFTLFAKFLLLIKLYIRCLYNKNYNNNWIINNNKISKIEIM